VQLHARPAVGRSRNGTRSDRAHELDLRVQVLPPRGSCGRVGREPRSSLVPHRLRDGVRDIGPLRPVHRRRLVPRRRRRCNRLRRRVRCGLDWRRPGLRHWDGLRCRGRIRGLDRSRDVRGNRRSGHRLCDGFGRNVTRLGDRHRRRIRGSRLDRRSLRFGLRISHGGRVHRLLSRTGGTHARLCGCAWLGHGVWRSRLRRRLRHRLWERRVRYVVRCRGKGLRRSNRIRDRRLDACVGFRSRLGRRALRLRCRRRRADPRREKCERIEVALVLRGDADAQMEVRLRGLRRPARPDRPDGGAFRDDRIPDHADRPEMSEGHGQSVWCLNRHTLATRRYRSGERDGAGGRSEDRRAGVAADVDPTMLATGVWVGRIEDERL